MKILRSITHRGFSLGTAGWFTVLRPNTWFPASRLPRGFHYRAGESAAMPGLQSETTLPPRIMVLNGWDRSLVQVGLVVLAAMGITCALLWWIMHP